ncbi:hypothetical protein HDU76_012057, partial [Blyttiomyces sp. JEL0837]
MDLMYSAAAGKPADIRIFTSFNYLKPEMIFKLCSKWIQGDIVEKNQPLFKEISVFLQGRPRFFISFLHRLVESDDIDGVKQCFKDYCLAMTTNSDSSLHHSSMYYFWKDRLDWSIEPLVGGDAFDKRLVSHTLLKLCVDFLFGNSANILFHPDVELLATSLVMVNYNRQTKWEASMTEPMVLCAGVNCLADTAPEALMNYF